MAKQKKDTKTAALDPLFRAVCDYLIARIESKEATPADVKNAIQFLKDNGISALISDSNPEAPLNRLIAAAGEEGSTLKFPYPVSPNLLPDDDPVITKEAQG